jgi:hypothetical protein
VRGGRIHAAIAAAAAQDGREADDVPGRDAHLLERRG